MRRGEEEKVEEDEEEAKEEEEEEGVHLEPTDGELADGEMDADGRVGGLRRGARHLGEVEAVEEEEKVKEVVEEEVEEVEEKEECPTHQIDGAAQVGQLGRVDLADVPGLVEVEVERRWRWRWRGGEGGEEWR